MNSNKKLVVLFDKKVANNILGYSTALNRRLDTYSSGYSKYGRAWGVNYAMWAHVSDAGDVEFDTLDNVKFEPGVDYVYCIPCSEWHEICSPWAIYSLPEDMLDKFAKYNVNLLYDYTFEVLYENYSIYFHDIVYQYLCRVNADYSGKILISSANKMTGYQLLDTDLIRYITLPGWVHHTTSYYYGPDRYPDEDIDRGIATFIPSYLSSRKQKLYLNLNNQPRTPRVLFIHGLMAEGLFDNGVISFLTDMTGRQLSVEILSPRRNYSKNELYCQKLAWSLTNNVLNKMVIDADNADDVNINALYPWSLSMTTCFDIVSETTIDHVTLTTPVITEKIVKTMLFGKPFMISGDAGSLELVRSFGFKTFPFLFDESYDNELNLLDRHYKIIQNIKKWVGREDEFMELVRQHRDVLEYNRDRVINFPAGKYYREILQSAINE